MAINKDEALLELFHQLPETDKETTLDFMRKLASSKETSILEQFYANLPEVDEPFSEEELRQMKDGKFVTWEEACRELEWDDDDTAEPKRN